MNLSFKENFISTKEAAKSSGYTPDYVARLIRSGKIVGQKIGHSWFVDRDSLRTFLADNHKQQKDTKISYIQAPMVVPALEIQTPLPVSPNAQKIREKIQEISSATNISSPQVLVESGFFSHAFALSVALAVVAFGAFGAQIISSSHVTDNVATIAQQTAEGFTIAFGTFPARIIAKMRTTTGAEYAIASAGVSPAPQYNYNPITFSSVKIALPQSFPIEDHRIAYEASVASLGVPHMTIRGTLATASAFLADVPFALGRAATGLAHFAISTDVSFAYGVATIAPQSARTTTLLVVNIGAFLEESTARLPALASGAYRNVTAAPAILAPALAQTVFDTEHIGINQLIAFAGNFSLPDISNVSRTAYLSVDRALASVQVATEYLFGPMPLPQ